VDTICTSTIYGGVRGVLPEAGRVTGVSLLGDFNEGIISSGLSGSTDIKPGVSPTFLNISFFFLFFFYLFTPQCFNPVPRVLEDQ
jgi:hypothetical protein